MASETAVRDFKRTASAPNHHGFAVAAWLVIAALSLVQAVLHPQAFFLSTDDAMRLAEVRDLMAGQSWFDVTQHRMNTPYGLSMHWSHLLDACIAALIFVFRIFLDPQCAETAAVWTWPLLLLLPVYLAISRIGARFAGREGALVALLLGVSCLALLGIFQPGRIDHHNLQLALGIWVVALLLDNDKPAHMAAVGALCALSLAIGLETLPYVALAGAVATGFWIWRGDALALPARAFGGAFAAAGIILFAGATANIDRVTASCDTYSLFFAPLVVAGGVGLCALSVLHRASLWERLTAACALAVVLIALFMLINPDCLSGPYNVVDAKLTAIYLSRIEEVQPAWRFAVLEPGYFISGYLYAVACFAATVSAAVWTPGEKRVPLIVLALFAGLALAIATAQVRGINFAILFGLPGMTALVSLALTRIQNDLRLSLLGRAAGISLAIFLASNVTFETTSHLVLPPAKAEQTSAHSGFACYQADTLRALDSLPRGRIAAFVDQGPGIVVYTHHDAVAGPYHRGTGAMFDMYQLFSGSDADARRVLAQRDIDYVVACPASPDYAFYAGQSRLGLVSRLKRHDLPPWLSAATTTPQLQVFRVVKDKL